jgi:hypothetical protein
MRHAASAVCWLSSAAIFRRPSEAQNDGGVFTRQRALRPHPPAEFFVEPLDHVRAAEGLPLCLGEGEEREGRPRAGSAHARAALAPRARKGGVGDVPA